MTFDGRHLWWKMTFDGRWPLNFRDSNFFGSQYFLGPKIFCFPLINKAFSVTSNWIYSRFNNLTFAQPYLERTFTWNSSVAHLSLACWWNCWSTKFYLSKMFFVSFVCKAEFQSSNSTFFLVIVELLAVWTLTIVSNLT